MSAPDGGTITSVGEDDLGDLLPLMRGYCDFYEVAPSDEDLHALSRSLIADPERDGIQLIARDADGTALGFATLFWTWSTTTAARIAIMNDLFVAPAARGARLGEALIAACARVLSRAVCQFSDATPRARQRSAQALYDRIGARRSQWLDYDLPVS